MEASCWYPYGEKENCTNDFSWPCAPFEMYSLYKNDGYGPPVYDLKVGSQKIGAAAGELYAAVAITEQGKIPGKAKDNTCWYSYHGNEIDTIAISSGLFCITEKFPTPYTPHHWNHPQAL